MANEKFVKKDKNIVIIREKGLAPDMTGFERVSSYAEAYRKVEDLFGDRRFICGAKISVDFFDLYFAESGAEDLLKEHGCTVVPELTEEKRAQIGLTFWNLYSAELEKSFQIK